MNGRLYDPVVGRFLSPDPYIQDPSFSQSYNRYAYALNNPLKFTDYSGEKWNWNYLNPFYHFQNFMQWVNDKTPRLRQNMVNAGVPNFGVNYNTTFGTGFSVGENPAYYPGYENKIIDGQRNISNHLVEVRKNYGPEWRDAGANSDFIQSLLLNPIRLKVPVAEGVSFGADAQAVLLASEFQPLGFAQIKYGPDKGKSFIFSELTGGAGWISADATINTIHFYYLGNTDNLTIKDFEGWMYASSFSVNVGLSYGMGISWIKDESDNYLIGVTKSFGIGVGPTIGSGIGGGSYTKIHKIWGY
jgi:hypothetical protein